MYNVYGLWFIDCNQVEGEMRSVKETNICREMTQRAYLRIRMDPSYVHNHSSELVESAI